MTCANITSLAGKVGAAPAKANAPTHQVAKTPKRDGLSTEQWRSLSPSHRSHKTPCSKGSPPTVWKKMSSSQHGEHYKFTQHLRAGGRLILWIEPHISGQKFQDIFHWPGCCPRNFLEEPCSLTPWLVSEVLLPVKHPQSISKVATAEKHPTSSILGVNWQKVQSPEALLQNALPFADRLGLNFIFIFYPFKRKVLWSQNVRGKTFSLNRMQRTR